MLWYICVFVRGEIDGVESVYLVFRRVYDSSGLRRDFNACARTWIIEIAGIGSYWFRCTTNYI
jgi:hypothetical protein